MIFLLYALLIILYIQVVYEVTFVNLSPRAQRELIFNWFRLNSQQWKCAISAAKFYWTRICSVLLQMAQETGHSTAKTPIFMIMKELRSYTQ
jgi:hypothetical protein